MSSLRSFVSLGLVTALILACGDDSGPGGGGTGASGGAGGESSTGGGGGSAPVCESGAFLPVADTEICVKSSAFGELYLEQAEMPDGYSVFAFVEPNACDYFLYVEDVIEEQGGTVDFAKIDLLGQLPGTCPITTDPDVAVPHDGSCVAVVTTRRFSANGKDDTLADGGQVVVTQLTATTLQAEVQAVFGGVTLSVSVDAPACPIMCTCLTSVVGCPCGT